VIVVAGEALVDLVIEPDGAVTAALGGAPFNTARAVARLGMPVEFVGALSQDRFGNLLREQLDGDGVGVGHAPSTDRPTTLAAAELDPRGGAQYRFYIDGTSAPALTADDVRRLPDEPDVLFTGGLGLVLEPMADTVLGVIDRLPASTTLVVDANCRPRVIDDRDRYVRRLGRVLARTDIVKVSDEDLEYLMPGVDLSAASNRLLEAGPVAVVVTGGAGATGLMTLGGSREISVAALGAPVVDTIGAGDTFGAALMVAWVERGGRRETLRHAGALDELAIAVGAAHEAAAVVVIRRGADPPWRRELTDTWAT
jgi:fructokinase